TSGGFGPGNSFGVNKAEKNTEDLCESIKSDGITLITVAFDLNDTATRNRLEDCASAEEYFFEAEDNQELAEVFRSITGMFQDTVRLTR
ncbi:MAG: hypothetical protein MI723_17850, partial [Caulobacterales bacterium]|nr:hypothetical protein [Caulobacterales bacterium]